MATATTPPAALCRALLAYAMLGLGAAVSTGCSLYYELPGTSSIDVGAEVVNWGQPDKTADGTAEDLAQAAPGADVTTTSDDSAGGAALRFNLGYEVLPREGAGDVGVDIQGWIEASQTGDFRSQTTVEAGGRAVRSISEFDAKPSVGVGMAPLLRWYRWQAGPTVSLIRHDFDIDIRDQRLIQQDGQLAVVDAARSQKEIAEWNACLGVMAGRELGPRLMAGLSYDHCSVNGSGYDRVAGYVRWELGGDRRQPAAMSGP